MALLIDIGQGKGVFVAFGDEGLPVGGHVQHRDHVAFAFNRRGRGHRFRLRNRRRDCCCSGHWRTRCRWRGRGPPRSVPEQEARGRGFAAPRGRVARGALGLLPFAFGGGVTVGLRFLDADHDLAVADGEQVEHDVQAFAVIVHPCGADAGPEALAAFLAFADVEDAVGGFAAFGLSHCGYFRWFVSRGCIHCGLSGSQAHIGNDGGGKGRGVTRLHARKLGIPLPDDGPWAITPDMEGRMVCQASKRNDRAMGSKASDRYGRGLRGLGGRGF
ncbi:protein of unknown function [Candidatus Filomicrobium marinum]|uniref:Uncharacterized protein n=1 Tax=Candidatus Filomicrobium marinum TaxID=1608628 RepID=A0A0D6JC54_9HYPH|nr:protein of unknown function [Candidatus Filomicrobium marinum]